MISFSKLCLSIWIIVYKRFCL